MLGTRKCNKLKMEDVAKETKKGSENQLETIEENSFLKKVLSKEEYELLPSTVVEKIENSIQESFEEFLTCKALYETSKIQHDEEVTTLKQKLQEINKSLEDAVSQLDIARVETKDLQERLQNSLENVEKLQEKNKQLKYEWEDFKIQRDHAVDEKESLLQMVERRNSELANLKSDVNDLTKQLNAAVKAKMVALENSEKVESLKISLTYKEKRLEQESALLKNQLQCITEELNKQTNELIRVKRENSTKSVATEAEIAEKTQQLAISQQTISDLRDANEKLTQKVESLLEKLSEQRNSTDQMFDNFQQELQAQTKLSQLYKGLCEENDSKTQELTSAINELQLLLKDASDQYGTLETKQKMMILEHEEEIIKKNECIKLLKKELEDANELLKVAKEENLEAAMATLSPCAAAASRLIKSGMTLTQIYTQYATVSEQLLLEKEENRKLTLYVNTILNEIEEKAPILKQQKMDYENALSNVETLTKQMDDLIAESKVLQQECSEAKKSCGFLKRENERLKKEVADLSRQVCYLIKSVEEARGGMAMDLNGSQISYDANESSAQHVISKKLVTFASIQDLQENNQKLLSLVRQLSAKQEATENISSSDFNDLKAKEEKLQARVNELMEDMERQSKMLDLIKNQSLTYKKLYEQSIRGEVPENALPVNGSPIKSVKVTASKLVTSTPKKFLEEDSNQVQELKNKVDELEKNNRLLEEEKNKYKAEIESLDKQLSDQIHNLKKECNDLIYKNSKLVAQAEFFEEKCKVMETNIKSYKKQIQALEERNQMLGEISAKHEQSIVHLREEVLQLQGNLSKTEVSLENMRQENFLLKTAEARLLKEKECWSREMHSHSLLMSNLDAIKATFERSEEEGKLRLEAQLSEAVKESSALKSALKEEKIRFKELAASLERQTNLAKERMLEEKKLADKAREDLENIRQDLETKNRMIEELHLKIRELNNMPTKSVIESVSLNLDESTKRNKELEKKIRDLEQDVSSLRLQLTAAKQHNTQYCEMAESLEKQLNEANENHENFRGLMTAKVEESLRKENDIKKKYEELEQKYLNVTKTQKNSTDELNAKLATSSTELKSTNTVLTNMKNELTATENELKKAKDAMNALEKSLQEAEAKYSNEVVLHSSDIQTLNSIKKELSETMLQITKLQSERDNAVEALKLKSSSWEEKEKKSVEEMKELNQRVADLDEQNRVLHENIQELGNQVAILQCRVGNDKQKPVEDSPSFNESTELSSKAQDQLLKVIKFLRQEKDLSVTRSEILQAENTRLKTQLGIALKELEECKENLKNLQESTDASAKASAKHAELLRKIDTLNAITDSNRILREDRDKLQLEVKKLKELLEKADTKVMPLNAEIKKLNEKIDTLSNENQALMLDIGRWKSRAERTTRGTPEDWRRLTNERENLAKQWQQEKNNNEKLEDELKKLKQEKNSLNEQVVLLQKNLQNETNETKRLTEECNSYKQQLIKANETLNAVKSHLTKVTEEMTKLTKKVEDDEALIKELKAKEDRLKRVCTKYKKQYEILVKQVEDENKAREEEKKKPKEEVKTIVFPEEEKEKFKEEGRAEMKNELTPKMTEMESKFSEKIKELEATISSAQEESENLRKDNENLKTSINEKEERVKTVLKNARMTIAQLSEQKKNLELQLEQAKGQSEMSRDESDSKLNNLKAHYESKISEIEKERTGQVAERDQERDRLNNQIKVLSQKLNQMQRMFEKQLGSKPSTSSRPPDKSPMEPPTANIKPMAGSSSSPRKEKQTTGPVGPCWRSGNETPFASIRPTISMQSRTLAVLPTSQTSGNQTSSSQSTPVMVLPQQQVVHTTGSSGEAMSSSPTSSHTDYMPATSSATPTRQVVVAPPLSIGQHSGADAQSTQEMEAEANDNDLQQQSTSQQPQSLVQQQQMQTVAMVMPRERVEQQTIAATTQGNQQQSIDQSCGIAYSQANSSNTVTTTQAGLKRTRDVEGDSSTGIEGEDLSKMVPQGKRIRVSVSGNQAEALHHQVTHSEGIEVEYQVPTSSQRDQEDDNLIMIDSDDDGNADEGDMEGGDDEHEFEEDNGGYEIGSYSRDGQDLGIATYDEGPDIDEENVTDQDNNEVEVVDEGNEVPNQSGSSRIETIGDGNASQSFSNASVPVASSIESAGQDQSFQQSSEATSSGPVNNESGNNVVVVSHAASSLSSQTFRNRNVPLLNRQQQSQLILPQSYEESGDDSIVPSTPTLFVPRRTDGFGEAVSSPQIPHQGRFTFSDPSAPITRSGILPPAGEGSEDSIHLEEPGTGRSVPTTPLQVSPQELPTGETVGEVGQSSSSGSHIKGEESDVVLNIPDIVVTISEDDDHCETLPPELSESAGEEEEEHTEKEDTSGDEPEVINLEEDNDGVTSEGEKPLSGLSEIEEGREAEASEPFESTNISKPTARIGGSTRRSMRMGYPRRSQSRKPTPIVWNEPGSSSGSSNIVGSAIPSILDARIINSEQRGAFRGRMQRARKWR